MRYFVFPVEATVFCQRVEESCVVRKGLGRLRRREEEPLIKGVPNLLGHEAGLFAKTDKSTAVSMVSRSWSS